MVNAKPTPDWDPWFLERLPLFEPLQVHGAGLALPRWPALADLQTALDARGVTGGGGRPLRVIAQVPGVPRTRTFEERYEARIYLKGELAVRERNWHDLFNTLVWLTFPRAKAAINARHYQALQAQQARGAANRGPAQDALTLFDEGGVIVASSVPGLLAAVRDFAWKRLFWEQRAAATRHMRWVLFGHAIYEKALTPFTGITGRGVLLAVEPDFHDLALAEQLAALDERVAGLISRPDALGTPRELAPAPILGVPGWWPANREEAYYDNTDYFRHGRRGR